MGRTGGANKPDGYVRTVPPLVIPATGMVLFDGTSNSGDPYWIDRDVYYSHKTFRWDHYCAESWELAGPALYSMLTTAGGCVRDRSPSCIDPEAAGSTLLDVANWFDAIGVYWGREIAGEPLYYPHSEYPLGM